MLLYFYTVFIFSLTGTHKYIHTCRLGISERKIWVHHIQFWVSQSLLNVSVPVRLIQMWRGCWFLKLELFLATNTGTSVRSYLMDVLTLRLPLATYICEHSLIKVSFDISSTASIILISWRPVTASEVCVFDAWPVSVYEVGFTVLALLVCRKIGFIASNLLLWFVKLWRIDKKVSSASPVM